MKKASEVWGVPSPAFLAIYREEKARVKAKKDRTAFLAFIKGAKLKRKGRA